MGSVFGREALSPRGRWLSITAATLVMQFSYWPAITAAALAGETGETQVGLLALSLAIAPAVFVVLAFGSRHARAPGAVLRAMGLMLVLGASFALVNPVVGLVAAFAGGGAVALRPPSEDVPIGRWRSGAVVAAVVYIVVLVIVGAGPFVVLSGAVLPLTAVGIADEVAQGRSEDSRREVS